MNSFRQGIRSDFYNPEQNIWNKIEKFSQIGCDLKSLISTSAGFLNCYYQKLISGRETRH